MGGAYVGAALRIKVYEGSCGEFAALFPRSVAEKASLVPRGSTPSRNGPALDPQFAVRPIGKTSK
jgi:hypothetical protein